MPEADLKTLLKEGRTAEAGRLAEARLRESPEDKPALLALAKTHLVEGRLAEAEALWARAAAQGADFDARLVEAALLSQKGQAAAAQAVYEGLVQEDPKSGEAQFGLGFLLNAQGRFAEAEAHLARAAAIDPESAPAHFHYANALARQGKARDAVEHLRRSMDLNPTYLPGYFVLADILKSVGAPEKAIEVLLTGLELHPHDPDLTAVVTNLLAARGEWRQAHELAFETARAHPENPHAVSNLARFLMSAQRFDEALGLCARLEREGRATVESCLVEGMIHEFQQPPRWEDAERAYRRAGAVDRGDWSGPNNLGLLLLRQDSPERLPEAIAAFQDAMARSPQAPEPAFNLARIYARDAARAGDAIALLDSLAARLEPSHPLSAEVANLRQSLPAAG